MNTNGQISTMYESIPAVAGLNRVPGFEPFKLLRRIASPEEGKVALQLDLRFKKLWFRLAHPKGRIRLNPLRITEQMAIFEAQVYLERGDENPVGSFTSCCTKEDAPGGQYVQAAQFEAMDEALTNAGFGVQFADVSMDAAGSRYGSRILLPENRAAGNAVMVSPSTEVAEKAGDNRSTGHTGSMEKALSGVAARNTEAVSGKENAAQGQKAQEIGTARAFHPVPVQRQAAPSVVETSRPAVNTVQLAVGASIVPPAAVQEQAARSAAEKTSNAQPVMASGKDTMASGKDARQEGEKKAVQAGGSGAARTAVQRSVPQPAGSRKPVQAAPVQKQPPVRPEESSLPVQPQTAGSQPVQKKMAEADALPVKSIEPIGANALPIQPGTAAASLPAESKLPMRAPESNAGPEQPESVGIAATLADTLPAPEKRSAAGETKSSVQGAMALLGGRNFQTSATEMGLSAAGLPAGKSISASAAPSKGQRLPASASAVPSAGQPLPISASAAPSAGQSLPMSASETVSASQSLPVSANAAPGEAASRYTPDMPVEEIVKLMTFEEAEKVVVDIGVCKGMTMAEVAERRPPSLKFYLYGGYKGGNNSLRAAAQIMLDSLAMQKAG